VQLEHDPVETTRYEHGYVEVKAPDGSLMIRLEKYQHNAEYHNRSKRAAAIVATVLETIKP